MLTANDLHIRTPSLNKWMMIKVESFSIVRGNYSAQGPGGPVFRKQTLIFFGLIDQFVTILYLILYPIYIYGLIVVNGIRVSTIWRYILKRDNHIPSDKIWLVLVSGKIR